MSKFKEAVEVMERIDAMDALKDGKMLVKGTIIMEGGETIHTSLDNTTTKSVSKALFDFTEICTNCIRTVEPSDKVEFIKINFTSSESNTEVLLAPDDEFQAIVLMEHRIRDLRNRSLGEQKSLSGYRHVQENLFFPSLDGMETPQK